MSTDPARQEQTPAGWPGLAVVVLRVVSGMTNEKLMLLVVLAVLGYSTFFHLQKQAERETFAARMYEESRTEDRKHCDAREDKQRSDLSAFFAQQADLQRRHDAERESRLRQSFVQENEKVRAAVALLTAKVVELEALVKKP